jgi:hypothetical protein
MTDGLDNNIYVLLQTTGSILPLNISAAPLDGSWDLVAGTCKRIVFTVPLTPRSDLLQFVVQNMDFRAEKFVHWCGLNIKKVGLFVKGGHDKFQVFCNFCENSKGRRSTNKFSKSQIPQICKSLQGLRTFRKCDTL